MVCSDTLALASARSNLHSKINRSTLSQFHHAASAHALHHRHKARLIYKCACVLGMCTGVWAYMRACGQAVLCARTHTRMPAFVHAYTFKQICAQTCGCLSSAPTPTACLWRNVYRYSPLHTWFPHRSKSVLMGILILFQHD